MGYETWYGTNAARVLKYSYPASCDPFASTPLSGRSVTTKQSQVTSYRGPIQDIKVGSKKRRVVRHFKLQRFLVNEAATHLWCPAPGKVIKGRDLIYAQFENMCDRYKAHTQLSTWFGSTFPLRQFSEHTLYGEQRREVIVQELYTKLHNPRWDGAVFFGELGETLVSIKELFIGAIKAFTKARKAWKTVKHLALNSEELWLWYRYFLLPAMLDAEDLIKAIKPQARIDRVQTGRPKRIEVDRGTVLSNGWWSTYTLEIPWVQEIKFGTGGAIDIIKRFDPNEWGFGAVDLLRAGWEVFPWSFVWDWFVNVGDWLTTLRELEIDYAQSYATYAIETNLTLNNGPDVYLIEGKPPTITQVHIERIIDLEPPTHPTVNRERLSFIHTIDAISLATGIIKNILRGSKRR